MPRGLARIWTTSIRKALFFFFFFFYLFHRGGFGIADHKNRINFKGLTETTVNTPLSCEKDAEGVNVCYTEDTSFTWVAEIKNVTWASAPAKI